MWYDTFDAVFFLTISAGVFGILGLSCRLCYKSKCKIIRLFGGCVSVLRDTKTEENIDLENPEKSDKIPSKTSFSV